jgi:hypothetical protein
MRVGWLRLDCQFLAGGEESLNETITGRIALNIVGVDVERKRDDGIAVKS